MTKSGVALVVVLAVGVVGHGTAVAAGSHAVRYLMGTWCDLTLWEPRADERAAEAAFQEIARLERVLSSWDPESELSRLNAKAGTGLQSVSTDLALVAGEATALCRTTGGAFDPTVAPLLRAWGFFTESPDKPSPERVREAAARVGCQRVSVQRDPPSIGLADGAALDLGGIGKGYAVDRAVAVLRAKGVTRARLDFGSSSLGFIGHVDGGWPVVIADPRDRDQALLSFRVNEGAVSSSGQRERSIVRDGRRYGHIFDPRTGAPVDTRLLVVTVIAPRGSTADGLSTALVVMGADAGARLVTSMAGVSAIFVEERNDGNLTIKTAGRVDSLTRLTH